MNTAVLGLNMMLGELGRRNAAQLTAAEEADRLETLTDINMACMTAVDILNGTVHRYMSPCVRLSPSPASADALIVTASASVHPRPPQDLLSFEKMESGIMELHTERVPALAFVGECFAMFEVCFTRRAMASLPGLSLSLADASRFMDLAQVHAKSKGIRVVSDWGPAHTPVSTSAAAAAQALRPCDLVVLDKFKLSQVPRNSLLSPWPLSSFS
jgi:hypothetical protein